MKLKAKKSSKKRGKSRQPEKGKSPPRKIKSELTGLLLVAVALFLGVSILTYHQGDPVGFLTDGNVYEVHNLLGPFGSTIASPLFQWSLGFPILVLPIVILLSGFFLLLGKTLRDLIKPAILLISWSILISILLAIPETLDTAGEIHSYYPSGLIGGIIATYLIKIFSTFGSFFVLTVIFLILFVFTFRLRISSVPVHLVKILSRIIEGILDSYLYISGRIKEIFSRRRAKAVSRQKIGKRKVSEPTEEKQEPIYNPSLPSEKESDSAPSSEPIEIIHTNKKDEKIKDDRLSGKEVFIAESEKTIPGDEAEDTGDLGFEIEEAHVEKELDYDTLVRDSLSKYQFPSTDLLSETGEGDYHLSEDELKMNARLLEETLLQFGVQATVNRVVEGPVITLYEVKPAQGVKIRQIANLADDLALAMRAKGIRIMAPIPGKAAIGIEIPNREPSIVSFRSIVRSETFLNFRANLPLAIGKTISGEIYCVDLTKMPHLLIAGATGSGKSVGINTMLASLLYRIPPSDLKFVLIDPKKLELSIYTKLRDHYLASCKDLDEIVITHPQNAIMVLRSVVNEMEERYDKLAAMGVREINHFNKKIDEYQRQGETSDKYRRLPYLIVVIDELADLILSATREVEEPITRLAQMARAVGIHLVMATQRPSVDILTGLIKANFPARIAYQVATRPDSKVILDMYGAEKMIGNGDMLFLPPGKVKPLRLQNPLITTEEVERVIKHISKQPKFPSYELKLIRMRTKNAGTAKIFERDELFEDAKAIVVRYQQGSISLLQRKLKIGYARAARIVDELEEAGIVGPQTQEGKAREVLVSGYSPQSE